MGSAFKISNKANTSFSVSASYALSASYVPSASNISSSYSLSSSYALNAGLSGSLSSTFMPYSSGPRLLSNSPLFYDGTDIGGSGFKINIGGGADNSGDSVFLISRTLTGSGNAHAFSDNSIFRRASYAYNSIDLKVVFNDSSSYDHYAGIQPRVTFGISNTFNNVFMIGSSAASSLGSGSTLNNYYGVYSPPIGNTGTITNNYGFYYSGNPSGVSGENYGIKIASGGGYLGGNYNIVGSLVSVGFSNSGSTTLLTLAGQGLIGVNSSKQIIQHVLGPGLNWNTTITLLDTVTNKATSYTIVAPTDRGTTFKNASGVCAFTLPASPTTGDWFDFDQASNGNNLSISAASAILLDGSNTAFTTFTSSVRASTCRLMYDGANWIVKWKNGTWVTS